MEPYTKETLDHFMNPRNMGVMDDADATSEVGNLRCGDVMKIYLKIGKRPISSQKSVKSIKSESPGEEKDSKPSTLNPEPTEEYIEDIKFQTLGCAAAIAASSMMTELVKGKSVDDALNVSRDDINQSLGVLPKPKYHCSILSDDAIKDAIEDYRKKKNK